MVTYDRIGLSNVWQCRVMWIKVTCLKLSLTYVQHNDRYTISSSAKSKHGATDFNQDKDAYVSFLS